MDALVMCGGRGTRLGGDTEKPLTTVDGRPMVNRVLNALVGSRVGTIHPVVSPHATATRAHLAELADGRWSDAGSDAGLDGSIVDAPGEGYVADLRYALEALGLDGSRVLTVAADLPLLDGAAVDTVLDAARAAAPDSLTVRVPAERKRELGVSADSTQEIDGRAVVPAGINVVSGATDDEAVHLTDDRRIAVNVNYASDVRIAEALLSATGDGTGGGPSE
ncbi:adenosylcobinamide-phosphate guanylyltransferase [Halorubrum alkaliphilum]|uniref:Adenosylcobinamide-phosphate guanylyltransferase n=1 Tax=Halorubrum alkaliphilum TaxID=261290 RepID=A0A8T4GFP3_9EURY|nr:NTP transferase domain-containing protein [Halorubrum alkaliphilum]MBP1923006.1 adenosylcobinamide-phosphate guanylyltransferase [Halorubrum alkaliphilum]